MSKVHLESKRMWIQYRQSAYEVSNKSNRLKCRSSHLRYVYPKINDLHFIIQPNSVYARRRYIKPLNIP